MITLPTRISENTSSLLDHILTNSEEKISQNEVIDIGFSDHQLMFCTRKITHQKYNDNQYIKIRSLKNYTKNTY